MDRTDIKLEASSEYFEREMAYGLKAEAPPMTDRAAGHGV